MTKHSNRWVNIAIETCADDITELRACDVSRALTTAAHNGSLNSTADYIRENRVDLVSAVDLEQAKILDKIAALANKGAI